MKLQAGLLHVDGRPVSQDDFDMLLGEFVDTRFEVSGEAVSGSVLMAYRGDRITEEEEFEVQPLKERDYAMTWDGRLDNREDFSICFPGMALNEIPDSAIVLQAYQMFGEAVWEKFIGEFALTLWTESAKSILFVRSTCGARPLYYAFKNDTLIWSSRFAHLVRAAGVDLVVNDSYVLQYLVMSPDTRSTPLSKVRTIPPNHVVCFENGTMKCGRDLWNPSRVLPLRYRCDQDYEEHCRESLKEAVRVRLRAKGTVFAEMSGGFDSSTIALTADAILRERNESPHRLQTVSCVYEQSSSADERPFIRAVEEKRNIQTHLIYEEDQRITLGLENPEFTGPLTSLRCFPGRYEAISRLMQHRNARVLLTGRGGDHLFWSAAHGEVLVADQLVRSNLRAAHRECVTWSRVANVPYFEFWHSNVLLSAFGRSAYKPEIPAWVRPDHRTTILAGSAEIRGANWCKLPSRRRQCFIIDELWRMLSFPFGEEYSHFYPSHPYSHRPLVEFILGTPVSQLLRAGETRSLMRRAFRDLLPLKTAQRVSKGLVNETVFRAAKRELQNTTDIPTWEVCQRGYVVPKLLDQTLNLARMGVMGLFGPLIRLFSLELWLRSLSRIRRESHVIA